MILRKPLALPEPHFLICEVRVVTGLLCPLEDIIDSIISFQRGLRALQSQSDLVGAFSEINKPKTETGLLIPFYGAPTMCVGPYFVTSFFGSFIFLIFPSTFSALLSGIKGLGKEFTI